MRYSIIYLLILLSPTLSAQTYPVPKEKLHRLLDVFFYDYPACQQSNKALSTALDSMRYALHEADTLIQLRTLERDIKKAEADSWRKLTEVNKSLHESETKKIRKQRNKLLLGLGVESVLMLVILL